MVVNKHLDDVQSSRNETNICGIANNAREIKNIFINASKSEWHSTNANLTSILNLSVTKLFKAVIEAK